MPAAAAGSKNGANDHAWHRKLALNRVGTRPPIGIRSDPPEITVVPDNTKSIAGLRRQAARDQVRVAYGAVPVVLEGLPAGDPFRTAIRDRARSLLVEMHALTAQELDTLPIEDAIATALRRLRG